MTNFSSSDISGLPIFDKYIMNTINIVDKIQVHHGVFFLACLELKKCLIRAPITITIAKISQLNFVANTIG